MNKEKFFLGLYMVLFAAGAITIQLFSMATSGTTYVLKNQIPRRVYVRYYPVKAVKTVDKVASVCVSGVEAPAIAVGGLGEESVSHLPSALRLDYGGNGTSLYTIRAREREIINYYLPQLASQCWELSALAPHTVAWQKDGKMLQLAVRENAIGAKTLVDYRLVGGRVLGESYQMAQTTCTADQVRCYGTNDTVGWCQMPPCPPPPTTPPPGGTTPPPSGTTCPPPPSCPNGFRYDSSGCPTSCMETLPPPSGTTPGSCTGGQTRCFGSSSDTMGWCQIPPCPPMGPTTPPGPGSCSGGQVWCPNSSGSGGWCQMPPCPSSSGSTPTSCPSGQYSCNNVCIPMGQPCAMTGTGPTSCSGGQVLCSPTSPSQGTMNWCQMPPCPTSGGTQYPSSCPSGQYMCNNACVANGTSCNNYPYYPPGTGGTSQCASGNYFCPGSNSCIPNGSPCGTTTQQPTTGGCGSGTYWCPSSNSCISTSQSCGTSAQQPPPTANNCGQCKTMQGTQCVQAPVGYQDPLCNGGVCDQYGGCVRLPSGKTMVGSGAICGDKMCDNAKGENSGNCPADCGGGMPSQTQPYQNQQPMPPGSPNQGQFPGQGQNQYQGQPGQFPGGPGGPEGQMGPNGEEQQKMDERRFQDMKRGLSQFSKGVTQMTKMVKQMEPKLAKLGVSVPPELKAALEEAPAIVEKIKNAKTPDELDEIISDVQDAGEVMQEWGPRFGDLMRLGNMLKQMDKDLKNVQRSVKKAQSYVKSNPALQEIVNELVEIANSMTSAAASIKELAKTDPEAALDKLDDEFYGRMEEFWNQNALIDMMRNLKKGLSDADRGIKDSERIIKQLIKKKVDPTVIEELQGILTTTKEKLAEIKALMKQPDVDPEELRAVGEELWDLKSEFENKLAELGQGRYMPTVKGGENYDFQMPQGFMSGGPGGPEMGPGGPGGFGGPGTGPGGPGGMGSGPGGPGF